LGKRNTRTHRRDPIRRPIPAARAVASRQGSLWLGELSDDRFDGGWMFGDQIRIRLAVAADLNAVAGLADAVGVEVEDALRVSVTDGSLGAGLRAGLRGGHEAFVRHMAETFFSLQGTGKFGLALLHPGLVLVAEHDQDGVVGALIAHPPVHVLSDFARQVGEETKAGRDLVLMGAIGMARIRAVAVRETVRRQGVGAAMVRLCQQIYAHCGYYIVYGQMPAAPGLDSFYRHCGFQVLPPGDGFDAWVITGVSSNIHPAPDERVFIWRRKP
jgi:GNAT superfamily N-acetyltransferase